MRLAGKTAVVTGAARGIGEAIARAFHAEGAAVWVTDLQADAAARVAASLGERAFAALLDVRQQPQWHALMQQVMQQHGALDILVNNAGITGLESPGVAHDPEHASLDAWREVHATNLDGVFLGCKHAIAAMRAGAAQGRGGSIINISSRSGMVGIPAAAAYASSKAAVRNHSKTVALYCAQQGLNIRCNSIHPAAILTPMWEPMLGQGADRAARMAALARDTPLQRFGTPQEVAALAVFLAADESAYMTGAELTLDGGLLAGTAATPAQ